MNNIDYRALSNNELKSKASQLETEFNENKFIIQQSYERMKELSVEYERIAEVLKERNVNDGKQ